ncbi:terminase small subunit [Mesorhizobium sp.]|uniref:terminase small subunit n=1 Tax=Mesorhizobium sp. TaxID=1871066 RepID=UPI00120B48B7|nr:MAG: hypothetical protein E5Y14_18135 [Mesorhizobium sp.]
MPNAKLNIRQERFCLGLAEGLPQSRAYIEAGYRARGNAAEVEASKMVRLPKVAARIAELQAEAARRSEITEARRHTAATPGSPSRLSSVAGVGGGKWGPYQARPTDTLFTVRDRPHGPPLSSQNPTLNDRVRPVAEVRSPSVEFTTHDPEPTSVRTTPHTFRAQIFPLRTISLHLFP